MSRKALIVVIAMAVVVLAAVIWVATRQPSSTEALKIGAVFPLTGDTASYGQASKRGIDLAIEEINAKGGVVGRPLKVVFEDDEGKASKAVSALQKLIAADRVPVVMGSAGSSVTLAMAPVANENKVALITPVSSSPELTTKGGPYFFRVCPSDVVQAAMMAAWFKDDGRRTAGVIYLTTSWGEGLKEEFVSKFTALGGRVLATEACKEGDRDLRAQLTKVKESNPDALYAITHGREGGALLRQAKELGITPSIYGADVWGSPELTESAGDAAKGVKIIVPTKYTGEAYQTFADTFKKRYSQEPDVYAAYAYDMTRLIAQALSGAADGTQVRDNLRRLSFEGVTGTTRFDQNGDVVGKGFERKVLP
jgi:branched-chain amino acid transport system substrate-binding protein